MSCEATGSDMGQDDNRVPSVNLRKIGRVPSKDIFTFNSNDIPPRQSRHVSLSAEEADDGSPIFSVESLRFAIAAIKNCVEVRSTIEIFDSDEKGVKGQPIQGRVLPAGIEFVVFQLPFRPVIAYDHSADEVNTTNDNSIAVSVLQEESASGRFLVRGLRDAIVKYKGKAFEGDPSAITIFCSDESGVKGTPITGELPVDINCFAFELPRHPNATSTATSVDGGSWPTLHTPPVEGSVGLTFVTITHGCFEPQEKERMIREVEYRQIWELLEDVRGGAGRKKGVLIKGHPGIGKTLLLDLLLSWSLKEHPNVPVIVIADDGITAFTNHNGKTRTHIEDKPVHIRLHVVHQQLTKLGVPNDAEILVLHDLKTDTALSYQNSLMTSLMKKFKVTCVVASSPKESNFNVFVKQMGPKKYLLPVLSFEETKVFVKHMNTEASDDDIVEYYDKVGGVPRHLYPTANVESAAGEQRYALRSVQFDPGDSPAVGASVEDTNKVVQSIPTTDRRNIETYDFVSANARREWFAAQDTAKMSKHLKRLREAKCNATRDVLGRVFEDWFVSLLKAEQPLSRQQLTPKPTKLQPWDYPKSMSVVAFPGNHPDKIKCVPDTDTLYLPLSSQCPVVDAVIVTRTMKATLIQVTVAETHKPKLSHTTELFKALKENGVIVESFVWVVDSSSKLKKKQDIDGGVLAEYDNTAHYLCRIDEPTRMFWVRRQGSGLKPVCFPAPPCEVTQDVLLQEIKKHVESSATALTSFAINETGTAAQPLIYH